MLQVYDRVITSGSVVTLVMLTVALAFALSALAGLDTVRARVLTRASVRFDRLLSSRVVAATLELPSTAFVRSQPLRDLDIFRQFVTGPGVHSLFDLPWAPIYIAVIFLLHPILGFFALASAVVLILVALGNEWLVRTPLNEANEAANRNYGFTEMSLQNSEVVRAMGMLGGLLDRWNGSRGRVIERQVAASDLSSGISSLIKFLRMAMQSLILGIGAWLAIEQMASAGAMFAASILLGRALQPVEQTVGQWRMLVAARAAYIRVRDLLQAAPPPDYTLDLPRPTGHLSVEGVVYAAPGTTKPILRGVSFAVEAGTALGIIGPSGAGKSTLSRLLIGVLRPNSGTVRLDGADVATWPRESLGPHVGYLPQDIELFADSVAANISRFRLDSDPEVIQAARMAGVHDLILRLANGYETQVGEGGTVLSAGYRQRIALARAVFGRPAFVILDEPSSNLDNEGDQALTDCIAQLKQLGTTVVIISHRPATLSLVDKILILREGVAEMFGDRAEILARLNRPMAVKAVPKTNDSAPPEAAAAG